MSILDAVDAKLPRIGTYFTAIVKLLSISTRRIHDCIGFIYQHNRELAYKMLFFLYPYSDGRRSLKYQSRLYM